MTREEAIHFAECLKHNYTINFADMEVFCDMAIKALEQEPVYFPPCVDCNTKMNEIREAYDKLKNQDPCEDAVSRKQALECVDERIKELKADKEFTIVHEICISGVKKHILELPSVTPTRKKGKWIFVGDNCFKCSECGEVYTVDQFNHINNYCDNRFPKGCPNCGAEMESEE